MLLHKVKMALTLYRPSCPYGPSWHSFSPYKQILKRIGLSSLPELCHLQVFIVQSSLEILQSPLSQNSTPETSTQKNAIPTGHHQKSTKMPSTCLFAKLFKKQAKPFYLGELISSDKYTSWEGKQYRIKEINSRSTNTRTARTKSVLQGVASERLERRGMTLSWWTTCTWNKTFWRGRRRGGNW
jgi:hypothetical protein